MRFLRFQLFFVLLFILNHSFSQTDSDTETLNQQSTIFTEAESEYIDQWFAEFVQEMNLSDEIATQYQDITNSYSVKMENIGKDNPNITKPEVVEQFNTLMESQHQEIKPLLTDEQYETYYDTMKKVVWSINQRLKHL